MEFALVNGERVAANPGLNGFCPLCLEPVIAKCGIERIHHWAHRNKVSCDSWSEGETEWHRAWKENYDEKWREKHFPDVETGEKHIADVCTAYGLVLEFQHSHIEPQERVLRETFYKNMVWVVDGTRLKGDLTRFIKGRKSLNRIGDEGVFAVPYPRLCFSTSWVDSRVPVVFDFRGVKAIDDHSDIRNRLFCLLPKSDKSKVVLAEISREAFIERTTNGEWVVWIHRVIDGSITLEPQKHKIEQLKKKTVRRRESQYILERGKWKKRYPRL
jgi:competence protein CoiA